MKTAITHIILFFLLFLSSCLPDTPATSSISIDLEGMKFPVNQELYGVTLEEINHAIDGGLYAEMVLNGSFEANVPPLNCPYDRRTNELITPNGYRIPFLRPDSIPGWKSLSATTYFALDAAERINERNRRSLLLTIGADSLRGRGGVKAEGFGGMAIRKGQQYRFSFYVKSASAYPCRLHVALEDSLAHPVSDRFSIMPFYQWQKLQHTFTATADADRAVLTISSDSSQTCWIDAVSLMPVDTWKGRANGVRPDLAEAIAALHPRFVRFPGGSFVEGYTAGTYPIWHETIGPVENRRQFWNVWAYGSTNGMGYHEFLQFCEDVGAEPVYVINSGVTSQSRRPRYEDITAMGKLVQDALDALAYANEPADSTFGAMRAANGHPEPFGLKFIEIGSENYGHEYTKRYRLFDQAIRERYPDVTVISNAVVAKRSRSDWSDTPLNAGSSFYFPNTDRYTPTRDLRRAGALFAGAFGYVGRPVSGTMEAALAEAAFLIGVERNPESLRRLAYAPLLGNLRYTEEYVPAIGFDNARLVLSPSYYMYKLFGENRGDYVLKSETRSYARPAVTFGGVGVYMFDNAYDLEHVRIDGSAPASARILSGDWSVGEGRLVPVPNRWNHILLGDSSAYDYTFSARFRRTKGSGPIEFQVRHNGRTDLGRDYIGLTIGREGRSTLFHQSGNVRDSLASARPFPIKNNQWYDLRISCAESEIRCEIDGTPLFEVSLNAIPSLLSVATLDTLNRELVLKVVNTTWHEEKTAFHIEGAEIQDEVVVEQLAALPDSRNTLARPDVVCPRRQKKYLSLSSDPVYVFPPHSITVMRVKLRN